MILIGQYDSPFVRRAGIALRLYELPFEHRPWSVFGDPDKIHEYNPLLRVPTLVLDDGTALVDAHLIIDYLDHRVGPERALMPAERPSLDRHHALRIIGLAAGISDKAVSLFYEQNLHTQVSERWIARCTAQINDTLALLERERAARTTEHWFGDRLTHADIAVAAMRRHLLEAHPSLIDPAAHPALAAHCAPLEALAVFREISQPFHAPGVRTG